MRPDELTQLRELLEAHGGIQFAMLFGSLAQGTERVESDIDIAVLAQQPLSVGQKMALIERLAAAYGRPVDLIDLRRAGEPLLGEILRGKRILGSDACFAQLLTRHLIDAADFGPLQQRILKERRDAWIS